MGVDTDRLHRGLQPSLLAADAIYSDSENWIAIRQVDSVADLWQQHRLSSRMKSNASVVTPFSLHDTDSGSNDLFRLPR